MAIAPSVLLKIALIVARGRDDLVVTGNRTEIGRGIVRGGDADFPVPAVGLGADSRDRTAEVEDSGGHAAAFHRTARFIRRVALRHRSEVDFHAVPDLRTVRIGF